MKKIYYDVIEGNGCVAYFSVTAQIIPAGTTIYSMQCKDKNDVYKKYADEYDVNFIFDDDIPQIDFYTIPQVDIFAMDSLGGYIVTLGHKSELDGEAPICYINKNRECYFIANSGTDFLTNVSVWKSSLTPCYDVVFYNSVVDAKKDREFMD